MSACHRERFALRRSLDIWREARTDVEKNYLLVEVLRLYLAAWRSLKALQGEGRLREVAIYFHNRDDTPLSSALEKAHGIMERISHAHLTYGNSQWTLSAGVADDRETVFEELCVCADRLGLLILNEVFQTTAYAEGAVGLYHILRYLSERGTHWIAGSHLTDLRGLLRGQVALYEMSHAHKATPVDQVGEGPLSAEAVPRNAFI